MVNLYSMMARRVNITRYFITCFFLSILLSAAKANSADLGPFGTWMGMTAEDLTRLISVKSLEDMLIPPRGSDSGMAAHGAPVPSPLLDKEYYYIMRPGVGLCEVTGTSKAKSDIESIKESYEILKRGLTQKYGTPDLHESQSSFFGDFIEELYEQDRTHAARWSVDLQNNVSSILLYLTAASRVSVEIRLTYTYKNFNECKKSKEDGLLQGL